MNSLQLLITTVYKSQTPPGTEPLKRARIPRIEPDPTAQLSILQNVVQTMTVLVRMNHHAKEYMHYTVGYHQLLEAVLLSRSQGVVPSSMLSLVWSMVFDHVGSSGTTAYTEYTEYTAYAAPPRTDDTSAPEAANEAKAAKEAKEVKEVKAAKAAKEAKEAKAAKEANEAKGAKEAKEAKAAIPTEIKNMGALSVLIALLPEVAKHDQHATLLGLLAVCQGAVGIQNRSA